MLPRAAQWLAIVCGLLILYLYGLDRMGLYGPDEPRYASIGREMARSGDFITPRLWGSGWFEKPPFLYWLIAAGFRTGLSNDLAPRVPVALFSVAFLIAFYLLVRREFGPVAATYAAMMLATMGGWLALSEVAVTDVPMAALFGLAVLFTLPWLRTGERQWLNYAAVALGAAVLAKSVPPLILALPALWFGRHRWRDLVRPAPLLLFLTVAVPWHIVCYLRNGSIFPRTLFLQQQFERFVSSSLQHVQPWYFYIWLLLLLLLPWTPALALLVRRELYQDPRLRYLLATAAWGFVFFSASINKLPFYLMPLLPPLAVLMAVALERVQFAGRVAITFAALACAAFPIVVTRLPAAMSRNAQATAPALPIPLLAIVLVTTIGVCFLRRRAIAVMAVALLAATGYLWIKAEAFPYVDQAATARPVWQQIEARQERFCVKDIPRDWRYGLNYYTVKPLADCWQDKTIHAFVYYWNRRVLLSSP